MSLSCNIQLILLETFQIKKNADRQIGQGKITQFSKNVFDRLFRVGMGIAEKDRCNMANIWFRKLKET
jgi:hypothetical protein